MERNDSIFYKMTKENENSTTELLCNLFRTKYIRDICLEFLGIPKDILGEIELSNISTQCDYNEDGIPDIVIENRNVYYIIENKITKNTKLQKTQKTAYVDLIFNSKKKYTGYIFLIPETYVHETEIIDMKQLNKITITIKHWNLFLDHLYKMEIQKESLLVGEALNYLYNLLPQKPVTNTILTPYEVAMMYNMYDVYNSLSFVSKLLKLIENTEGEIISKLGDSFSASDWRIKHDDLMARGKYINYNGNQYIFIGLNFDIIGNKDGIGYVYSIALSTDALKEKSALKIDHKYNRHIDVGDGWLYFKLNEKNLLKENQEQAFVDEIVEIIQEVFLKNLA